MFGFSCLCIAQVSSVMQNKEKELTFLHPKEWTASVV
jgi:hypothetical protein